MVNTRPRRALGCAPADRIAADSHAMLALPPVAPVPGGGPATRLARDHYVRLDSNDYSVHPSVIGRRIEVIADLDRVRVLCDGRVVADHERLWAWHQTITDPDHVAAARTLRRERVAVLRPVAEPEVEQRGLADYDTALGTRRATAGWRDGHRGTAAKTARDLSAEVAFLTRALKAPTLRESVARLAERARAESWTHEEFLVGLPAARGRRTRVPRRRGPHPGRPVPGPQVAGGVRLRPRPRTQTRPRSLTWAPWTSSPPGTTWCSSARPAPARPTWPSAWRSAPARPGTGSLFATAADWVARLADAHHAGQLQAELIRLGRYPLLVIDEVGYIPFEPEAANLFFQLVSSRYERASLIVTSNKPFGRWGEVFGDDVVAAAMIDRLVHHAEVIALKGDSYRLKDRDLGRVPAAATTED